MVVLQEEDPLEHPLSDPGRLLRSGWELPTKQPHQAANPRAKPINASAVAFGCSGKSACPARAMTVSAIRSPSAARSCSSVGTGAMLSSAAAT